LLPLVNSSVKNQPTLQQSHEKRGQCALWLPWSWAAAVAHAELKFTEPVEDWGTYLHAFGAHPSGSGMVATSSAQ